LAAKEGGSFHEATYQNVINGSYPMSRFLFVYINRAPDKPLDPLVKEFAKFIFSKEGQEVVIKDGFYPLPVSVIKEELAKIE
jgi:phosphate transport system substrate-binding protein